MGIIQFLHENWGAVLSIISLLVSIVTLYYLRRTFKADQRTKRYEFIEDYNFHFLTSDEFTAVERKLEVCYQEYENQLKQGNLDAASFRKFCYKQFGVEESKIPKDPVLAESNEYLYDKSGNVSEEHQQIINYLVFLESFVPLLDHKQIHYDEVDDLFGYRYFIAVNNPVLQETELIPEGAYYRTCHRVYVKWREHRQKRGLPIPLEEFDLEINRELALKRAEQSQRNFLYI